MPLVRPLFFLLFSISLALAATPDVRDPTKPTIAAYYVPRFPKVGEDMASAFGNLAYGIYIEYDRNVIWMFTNHGMYALATSVLGEAKRGVPTQFWPPRQ